MPQIDILVFERLKREQFGSSGCSLLRSQQPRCDKSEVQVGDASDAEEAGSEEVRTPALSFPKVKNLNA